MSRGNMVNNELRRYGAGRNTERIILPCWLAWPTCRRRTRIKANGRGRTAGRAGDGDSQEETGSGPSRRAIL